MTRISSNTQAMAMQAHSVKRMVEKKNQDTTVNLYSSSGKHTNRL
jgi:hypothetical protein